MLILREENPGEKPSKQWKESTTNSTHIWRRLSGNRTRFTVMRGERSHCYTACASFSDALLSKRARWTKNNENWPSYCSVPVHNIVIRTHKFGLDRPWSLLTSAPQEPKIMRRSSIVVRVFWVIYNMVTLLI
jgi:hypothetical protein